MALLKVGSRASVFVTHTEFVGAECQIFCHVGDVDGQVDTVAIRIDEVIENGLASPISQCPVGAICLALFQDDNNWYRARVLQNYGKSVKVFFIDYGNTETVALENVRVAPDYVLSIPALSTKCVVVDCTPLGGEWSEDEKKKVNMMLHSVELTCEMISIDKTDPNNEVLHVKLYTSDTPNTPIFVRPATGKSQTLQQQKLLIGRDYEVFVSYVDNAKKFWVQLKIQENELHSLMTDIGACFAEDLPTTGDIVNPVNGQVCVACFSDDGAFYRGIVQNIQGDSCEVFFVDYGNKEKKLTSELFTLPQALCSLPAQAILCSYKGDVSLVEDKLHELVGEEGPSILRAVSGSQNTGYIVEIDDIEKSLGRAVSHGATAGAKSAQTSKEATKQWHSYSSVTMQVDRKYDVTLSHAEHPGNFYVQLIENAKDLDNLMQGVDSFANSSDKLSNIYQGCPCLAKFSDGCWYRAEVVDIAAGKITVVAVDFGFTEVLPPTFLRNTEAGLNGKPAQAVQCCIDVSRTDTSVWTVSDMDRFTSLAEKNALVAKVTCKKGCLHQLELYDVQGNVQININAQFVKGVSNVPSGGASSTSNFQQQRKPSSQTVSLLPPEVNLGSKITLCFTALKLPYLYGQLTHTPVEKVAKLQTDLSAFFNKNQGELLADPSVGSVCCTRYVDGDWYRGLITKLVGSQAEVAFVDFGDSVNKPLHELKILPSQLCSLPQQCILCKIENLPASVQQSKIEEVFVDKRVDMKLIRKEGKSLMFRPN